MKAKNDRQPACGLPEPTVAQQVAHAPPHFPIIGIGASAGGLKAFEAFFSALPKDADPGMACVLVQHLAPDHSSILTELIKRFTHLPVCNVEDGMSVKISCVYIIPPNCDLALPASAVIQPTSPPTWRRNDWSTFFPLNRVAAASASAIPSATC